MQDKEELLTAVATPYERVFFSGSEPFDNREKTSYVGLNIERGTAYVRAWNDQHPGSLAFVKMCEQALERHGAERERPAREELKKINDQVIEKAGDMQSKV